MVFTIPPRIIQPLSKSAKIVKLLAPSLATAAAIGVGGSVVGVFVLLRREGLAALAMPHVVAVGAAIGMRMGWPSLPPARGAVGVALPLLGWAKRRGGHNPVVAPLFVAGGALSSPCPAHT